MRPLIGLLTLAAVFVLGPSTAFAEQVEIGHVETNDDTAINWLYFQCRKTTGTEMRCDIFQTLIIKKKTQAEIDAERQEAAADPLAEFDNNDFADGCKPLVENAAKMEQVVKSGIGVDGKPVNKRIFLAGWPMLRAMTEVCKNPTRETAGQFFKLMADRDERSCKVHNSYSQSTFTWNYQTNSWTSQEGPNGQCGTIVVGTLTQDPQNHFWRYVEKHLRTNPDGTLLTGQSRKQFPETTMNYTWQTTSTLEGCDFIESYPD
ncbi:MAG: hypothetical protein ABR929_15440 [Roseiarcus sp.]|jgi:hypothetical protein